MNEHASDHAGTRWDPDRYLRFADHRARPGLELLARIPCDSPRQVVDLGCGTGELTLQLVARWPEAEIHGLDHSSEMLERARTISPSVRWERADIATWQPQDPVDVVFSNAALHWVDDHGALFPRLQSVLNQGGCLAVQMPRSWELPSHRLMRETLETGGAAGASLGSAQLRRSLSRQWVLDAAFYYDLLAPLARIVDVWETEYVHVLEGDDPVLRWVESTGLRPVLESLGGEKRERFLAEYTRRLRDEYPSRADGTTLYPFRRLFVVAVR